MGNTGKKYAFTLIELLVVIAIIALLLAIIIPSLSRAKTLARRLVSSSNMRQIGIGMGMYADDNKGFFPETMHTSVDHKESWIYTLNSYLSDIDDIRICPADPKAKERLKYNTTSYIMNQYIAPMEHFGVINQSESFHNLHRLRSPANTITTFVVADNRPADDRNADHVHSRNWFSTGDPTAQWTAIIADIQPDRYKSRRSDEIDMKGSTLFLYADTQVKTVKAETIKEMADDSNNFARPTN